MMKNLLLFLFIALSTVYKAQNCSITYQYALGDRFYIDIPDCLEMQDGEYKRMAENFQQSMGNHISSDRVVFQSIGTNGIRKTDFVRVIYNSHYFGPGELKKLGSPFTQVEMNAQSNATLQSFKQSYGVKILSWNKPVNVKIGKLYAMKQSYTRQMSGQPPVAASIYYIQDYDRMYEITTSYRMAEADKWKPLMSKIILSLKTQ